MEHAENEKYEDLMHLVHGLASDVLVLKSVAQVTLTLCLRALPGEKETIMKMLRDISASVEANTPLSPKAAVYWSDIQTSHLEKLERLLERAQQSAS